MSLNDEYKHDLLESIPVVADMNLDIQDITDHSVMLKAPLNKNINYEGTAFGGSINTLAILSCYLLTHHVLKNNNIDFQSLVIQSSDIKYLKPVESDFHAVALTDENSITNFIQSLERKKVARILLQSRVMVNDSTRAIFNAKFVAQK